MSIAAGLEKMNSRTFVIVLAISYVCLVRRSLSLIANAWCSQFWRYARSSDVICFESNSSRLPFTVALASYGEINFVFAGFVYQCMGIAFEAARLVAIQKLLTGLKMTPLVALYNFAPVRRVVEPVRVRRADLDDSYRSVRRSTCACCLSWKALLPSMRSLTRLDFHSCS